MNIISRYLIKRLTVMSCYALLAILALYSFIDFLSVHQVFQDGKVRKEIEILEEGRGPGPAQPAPGGRGRPSRRGSGVRLRGRPPGEGPQEVPERPQEEEPGGGSPEPGNRGNHPQGHFQGFRR